MAAEIGLYIVAAGWVILGVVVWIKDGIFDGDCFILASLSYLIALHTQGETGGSN